MHMVQKWNAETALWLSQWVYNVRDKPVLITKVLIVQIFCYLAHASLVWVLILYFAMSPPGIHGNSCPNGSATGKWTLSSHTCCWLNHWKVQTPTSVIFVFQRESVTICCGILCYFLVWILKWGLHIYDLLLVVITLKHCWMCIYTQFFGHCWLLINGILNNSDNSQFESILVKCSSHDVDIDIVVFFLILWVFLS